MAESAKDNGCIEIEYGNGNRVYYAVSTYEADREASTPTGSAVLDPFPPVQDLTLEWCAVRMARVRICNRERYDQQMRQMLGLDG